MVCPARKEVALATWVVCQCTNAKEQGQGNQATASLNGKARKERAMGKITTVKVGRNADTGRFTTVAKAQQAKTTHIVETIKRQSQSSGTSKKK